MISFVLFRVFSWFSSLPKIVSLINSPTNHETTRITLISIRQSQILNPQSKKECPLRSTPSFLALPNY